MREKTRLRQYLYFCTGKASNLSTCSQDAPAAPLAESTRGGRHSTHRGARAHASPTTRCLLSSNSSAAAAAAARAQVLYLRYKLPPQKNRLHANARVSQEIIARSRLYFYQIKKQKNENRDAS